MDRPAAGAGQVVRPFSLKVIVVYNSQSKLTVQWQSSSAKGPFVGSGYLHDGNQGQGENSALFRAELPRDGKYAVRLAYAPGENRAASARVIVRHAAGAAELRVDQRKTPPIDGLLIELGVFFQKSLPAEVEVRNDGADGHVIADAVQWLPVEK